MINLSPICVIFLLISVIFVINGDDVAPKNEIEYKLLALLMRWRSGQTLLFLPDLNKITLNDLEGSYDAKGVQFSYTTSELQLRGLNNFSVAELNVSEAKLQASGKLVIPMITVTAENYTIQGRAYYMYTLKGSGRLKVKFRNNKLLFAIRLAPNGTSMKVAQLNLDFIVGSIEADLENSSWPINKMLNRESLKVLAGYHDSLINMTKAVLTRRIDDLFTTLSPKQLLCKFADITY